MGSYKAVRKRIALSFLESSTDLAVKASSHLLSFVYRKKTTSSEGLQYSTEAGVDDADLQGGLEVGSSGREILDQELGDQIVQHTFPASPAWTPESIEINSRKGRRSMCVVAKDRAHYRVFDLESACKGEETRENREDGIDDNMS